MAVEPHETHDEHRGPRGRQPGWLEDLPVAAYACDAGGRVTGYNRRAAELWGWEPELGDPRIRYCGSLRAFTGDGRPLDASEGAMAVALRTGEEELGREVVFERPDGGRRRARASVRPFRDAAGRTDGAVCLLVEAPGPVETNGTERARSAGPHAAPADARTADEDALRKKGERLRILWEAASVLLSADDPDRMLSDLFARIRAHLGVDTYFNFMVAPAGDALRLASCTGIPEETARSIQRLEFGQAICGTVAQIRAPIVATEIQTSDDPKVQLVKSFGIRAYACNPLIFDGKLLGTLSFASRTRDRFDEEEIAFLETICQYVTVAYGRLTLLDRLLDTNRREDEFLATLAHELRNPLAPVRNAVHLLRSWGSDEPELRWCRDVIERQVEHLTRLIDDLLDLSRITHGKLELQKKRMHLAEAVQAAADACRWNFDHAGQTLSIALPPDPVVLDADAVRLTQVFLNLLDNASKYTESGGRVALTAEREGREVVVRVRDNGIGIPSDDLERVFDLFFQVDRSLERSRGGLGIGLSLVRKIVDLHGGRVAAHSAGAGQGSEFVVHLPVTSQATAAAEPPPRRGETKGTAGCRILVVDDNRDAVDSLAILLQLSGVEAYTAYDGQAAVESAESLQPDVVLLDIGMPKMSGYEACRRIRAQAKGPDMVLIAVTGWGQEEDRRRSLEAGFDAHMVKPVDPNLLLREVAALRPTLHIPAARG